MIDFFINTYREASYVDIGLEFIAFILGVLSVWYAKKENIWVYPTGLICTLITVYLLYKAEYLGDMMMNIYYSIMSIYGWVLWSMKEGSRPVLQISRTSTSEKWVGCIMFLVTLIVTYGVYLLFDYEMQWSNYLDVFTSGLFFTAMWFMANKKIENWTLWIIADAITIPLYAYRGLGMLALQYFLFLILAIMGYIAWYKDIENQKS